MASAKRKRQSHQMFNLKGVDESDLMMGVLLSQKQGNDLIQNCDLPPPTKVFSGLYDNATIISDRKKLELQDLAYDDGDKKMGVLKALRLSQTRAREAEAKYAAIIKERDALAVAFVQDSMQIFAYRQFVRLLELQVSLLRPQSSGKRKQVEDEDEDDDDDGDDGGSDGLTWLVTVAFCLGIAGVGLAIGCKCFFY